MVGVSTHTIRAWEHRHGILQPQRTSARQRRYSLDDVQLLRDVKRAIDVNGFSLRVAFESVVNGPKAAVAPIPAGRTTIPDYVLQSGDTGVWRAVADVLPQLLILINRDGNIVEANSAVARTFGVVRQKLAGQAFVSLVDPFDRAKAVLLYRPRARTVDRWELNMATAEGPQLYSFRTWLLRRNGDVLLALIGSEMFAPLSAEPAADASTGPPQALLPSAPDSSSSAAGRNAFQALVEQFPFGVAVASIGADPRVVYANMRLARMLGLAPSTVTARRVTDLLPGEVAVRTLHRAVVTRTVQTLRNVEIRRAARKGTATHVDVGFQPLMSSTHKVVSVMIVLDDAAAVVDDQLRHLLAADHRLDRATTTGQLAALAVEHLTTLLPHVRFALAVAPPPASGEAMVILFSRAARAGHGGGASWLRTRLADAASAGASEDTVISVAGHPHTLTARPLNATKSFGGLAWLQPNDEPSAGAEDRLLEVFLADLAIATELLHLRADFSRKESRLKAIRSAVELISESRGRAALGTRFLGRLTKALNADAASIGRLVGDYYELEATYGGAIAKPGDRFRLTGQFTQTSFETGRPTASQEIGSPALPPAVRKALVPMRHGIAVPLTFMGRTTHVLTVLRKMDRPFDREDVEFVQSLSSIALLAVTPPNPSRAGKQPVR